MYKIRSSTSTIQYIPDKGKRMKKSYLLKVNEKLRRKVIKLNCKLEESKELTSKLKLELRTNRKNCQLMKNHFDIINDKIKEKDNEITFLSENCTKQSNLSKKLQSKCEEMECYNQKLFEKSKSVLKDKDRQMKKLAIKFQDTRSEIKKLQTIVLDESQKESMLKMECQKMQNTVEEVTKRNRKLEESSSELRKSAESLRLQLNNKDCLITEITNELRCIEDENKKTAEEFEEKVTRLNEKIHHLDEQKLTLKNENNSLKIDLKKSKCNNVILTKKTHKLYKHLKLYLQKFEDTKREKFQNSKQIQDFRNMFRKLVRFSRYETCEKLNFKKKFESLFEYLNQLKNHSKLLINYVQKFLKKQSNYRIKKDTIISKLNKKNKLLYNLVKSSLYQVNEICLSLRGSNDQNSHLENAIDDCDCS